MYGQLDWEVISKFDQATQRVSSFSAILDEVFHNEKVPIFLFHIQLLKSSKFHEIRGWNVLKLINIKVPSRSYAYLKSIFTNFTQKKGP